MQKVFDPNHSPSLAFLNCFCFFWHNTYKGIITGFIERNYLPNYLPNSDENRLFFRRAVSNFTYYFVSRFCQNGNFAFNTCFHSVDDITVSQCVYITISQYVYTTISQYVYTEHIISQYTCIHTISTTVRTVTIMTNINLQTNINRQRQKFFFRIVYFNQATSAAPFRRASEIQ